MWLYCRFLECMLCWLRLNQGFEITKNILSCDRARFRAWPKYCSKKIVQKIEIVRKSCYLKCNILLKYLVKRVIIVALISGKKMGRISLQSSKTTSCTNREIFHDFFRARVHARYFPWFRTLSETFSAKKSFFYLVWFKEGCIWPFDEGSTTFSGSLKCFDKF